MDETGLDDRAQRALLVRETTRRNDEGKGAKIANFREWTQLSEICTQAKKCVIAAQHTQLIVRKRGCW